MASATSACVKPLFMPMLIWPGQLRDLSGRDQRTDRDQAAVARRESGPQPQVAEQHVRRVLHHARKHRAEEIANALGAICLGCLIERQQLRRSRRKLVGSDLAFREHVLRDGHRRHALAQPA